MPVLGTAGHVDHGKSSLLRLLTGMEPSRLEEEKQREMTIQLGFVWFKSSDGIPIGIVDVPGHADYRRAMLTGISRVDGFLFTLACDDGWMAQSNEHLWALKIFGIENGIVLLTKCDLVSKERIAELKKETEENLFNAFGKKFSIIPYSSVTKEGLEELKLEIDKLVKNLPKHGNKNAAELVVDRAFVVQGHGLVVTGTLKGGEFRQKESIEILPLGKQAVIKSIQSYEKDLPAAEPNSRVAVQLGNIEKDEVSVGDQLVACGKSKMTSCIDVSLEKYPGVLLDRKKSREIVLVHSGSRINSKMVFFDEKYDFVRIHLDTPRWIRFGDPVLILSSGVDKVIGGGRVCDETAEKGLLKACPRIEKIKKFSLEEYILSNIEKHGSQNFDDVCKKTVFSKEEVLNFINDGYFALMSDIIVDKKKFSEWKNEILKIVREYFSKHKLEKDVPVIVLEKQIKLDKKLIKILVDDLVGEKLIVKNGNLSLADKKDDGVFLSTLIGKELNKISLSEEIKSFSMLELNIKTKDDKKVLQHFTDNEKIVRLSEDHIMSRQAFNFASEKIVGLLKEKGQASTAQLRDRLGVGRKLTIMILECMDRRRITILNNDMRKLL